MLVDLTHPFLWRCPDPEALVADCSKFNTFCSRLERLAAQVNPKPERPEDDEERAERFRQIDKFKGDGFELFVEALVRLFPCDKRLGPIEDYKVNTETDIGVDGVGVCGYNSKPITVQCKYRQYDHVLTANADHLTNFTSASMMHYGVDQKPDPKTQKLNMLIVTSADSLAFFTDYQMFGQKVFALCRAGIRQLVDDNPTFWRSFAQSWVRSLATHKAKARKRNAPNEDED